MAFGNSFSHNEDVLIQFYDGTATTPFKLKLEGTNSGAELSKGVKGQPQRRIVYKGNKFHNYKKDQEEVPEEMLEFTGTVFTEDFMGTAADARHIVEQFFTKEIHGTETDPSYHAWDDVASEWVALASTNDETNNGDMLRTDEFTLGLEVVFDTGLTDKATGYKYPFVEVVDFRWLDNDDLEYRVQVRVLSKQEEVEVIQALS